MEWPLGSNSRARSSGLRPARTRSTICRRNSGEYGGRVLGIASTSGERLRVSTKPGQSQTGVLEELLCRQIARLSPIEDRLGDIRREIAEADEPSEIGSADPFPLGECGKGNAFAAGECRVEPARLEEQLDQSRVRFRGVKRIGAVDHHSDLPPGAAQPYRHGQDLGFVVGHALRWCSSSTEDRGQPRRAETYADLADG